MISGVMQLGPLLVMRLSQQMATGLTLLLLVQFAAPAHAQAASSSAVPFAPMVIIALVLSLMAAALLVVAAVICHFTWVRRAAVEKRAAGRRRQYQQQQQQQQQEEEPSTVPKSAVDGAPKQAEEQPMRPSRLATPNEYHAAQVHEPMVAIVQQQKQRSALKISSPGRSMRDTASQFLEFLSRKWDMESAVAGRQPQEKPPASAMTTFKGVPAPPEATAAAVELPQPQPRWPNLADTYFDVCEQDVGQYDNLVVTAAAAAASSGEADRYEVAMELRDTRQSRASTPSAVVAVSPRDVQLTAGGGGDTLRSGDSVDWFEEGSAAL